MTGTTIINRIRELNPNQPETITDEVDGIRYELQLNHVEQLGCSFSQLRIERINASEISSDTLSEWGAQLASRVTYLLESIEPIELDEMRGQLLCRSAPPEKKQNDTLFFEIVLTNKGTQQWTRKRFCGDTRSTVDEPITMTFEMLEKLLNDLR